MKNKLATTLFLLAVSPSYATELNNGVQATLSFDELEYHVDDEVAAWASTFSLGADANQFNLVSEGGRTSDGLEGHELRAYYSKALSSKLGINLGWLGDVNPGPGRDWFLLGFSWETLFELETETSLFAAGGGRLGLSLEVERGYQIMPSLLLTPELKANFYSEEDTATGVGSGLSELELGLRLAYEVSPTFAPYVRILWARPYGVTADLARPDDEHESNTQFLVGVNLTF